MINDFTTLSVGDVAHVVTGYGADRGPFTVTKANKVKIELVNRNGTTYVFSVKTNRVLGLDKNANDRSYLITVEEAARIAAARAQREARSALWYKLKRAADKESFVEVKAALEELSVLLAAQ